MGGGALMTPALIFLGGYRRRCGGQRPGRCSGQQVRSGQPCTGGAVRPNLKLAGLLIIGSVPFAFAGAFIINAPRRPRASNRCSLTIALGYALLFTACDVCTADVLQLRYVTGGNTLQGADPPVKKLPTLLVGAIGGLLVGVTSVGSGSLIMVALLLLYPTLSAVRLVGTDLVQAVPLVLSAAVSHVLVSGVEWSVVIPLIIGGTPGTFLGARIANWVSQSVIRRGIVIVLSLTGLTMLGVPPEAVGIIGAGLLLLGPLAWGFLRQSRGLPAFDNNSAAWRPPNQEP